MRIPGIPGASEPSFRTRDFQWMGLDFLVLQVCEAMERDGTPVDPVPAKAAIQEARRMLIEEEGLEGEDLIDGVSVALRRRYVLLHAGHVRSILVEYARLILDLDIEEVLEA